MSGRSSSGGPRPAASYLPKITRQALGKRGLSEADVVLRWSAIVGDRLSRQCVPEKLVFRRDIGGGGVLQLCVEPAAATEIQHLTPIILERVNTYYGYRAVARLQLRQQPLKVPERSPRPALRALSRAERHALEEEVGKSDDSALRAALLSLGEHVLGSKSQ